MSEPTDELLTEQPAPPPSVPNEPTDDAVVESPAEAPSAPVDALAPADAPMPERRPAGVWADELRVPDWRFNAANLVEGWLATPRTAITRRGALEPGRDLTREQLEQGLARVDSVSCR